MPIAPEKNKIGKGYTKAQVAAKKKRMAIAEANRSNANSPTSIAKRAIANAGGRAPGNQGGVKNANAVAKKAIKNKKDRLIAVKAIRQSAAKKGVAAPKGIPSNYKAIARKAEKMKRSGMR